MPGHHSGRVLPGRLAVWLAAAAKLDLTELPGLDNLAQATGPIAESARLTANYYGSEETIYCVGGSTQGILAAIFAVVREQGEVLFLNPFHHSAWHGLVLRNARPQLFPVALDPHTGCSLPPTAAQVRKALEASARMHLHAVFLTSPTYEGVVADVQGIADVVHEYGLPLIVDEAHGAHLGLCAGLLMHSVAAGADVVIQSVHKMLPGLTQTAWIHVQGKTIAAASVADALRLVQTSSPSYLLLASLDAAGHWLRTEGPQVAANTLNRLRQYGLPTYPGRDPLKLWLPTFSAAASNRIATELAAEGIYVEYASPLGVLMICGMNPPDWLITRIARLMADYGSSPADIRPDVLVREEAPEFRLSPRQAFDAPTMAVPLAEARDQIAGAAVTPYPPGVPVLLPGQRIDAKAIQDLQSWLQSGYEVHGLSIDGKIRVVDAETHASAEEVI